MVKRFGEQIGIPLEKSRLSFEGCLVEIDGYGEGEDGTIYLVEAWAHIGKAKGSQSKKVLTDVLKLAFTADSLRLQQPGIVIKTYILFADADAADVLQGTKWGATAARSLKVKSSVIALTDDLKEQVLIAQKDQDVREPSPAQTDFH